MPAAAGQLQQADELPGLQPASFLATFKLPCPFHFLLRSNLYKSEVHLLKVALGIEVYFLGLFVKVIILPSNLDKTFMSSLLLS